MDEIRLQPAYFCDNRGRSDVLPQQVVREEIEKGRGTQFAPECADIMLQMIDEDAGYQLHEH